MSLPQVQIRTVWAPRAGHEVDEYEDAHAVSLSDAPEIRAAVADGATESAFSRGWAQTLVDGYVRRPALREVVEAARKKWSPPDDSRWYVQAKAAQGAHATFLGMVLREDVWTAEAVGDCCLFQFRKEDIRLAWPVDAADAFTHRPPLISSRSEDVEPCLLARTERWLPGDAFVLATDALAAWLLSDSPALIFDDDPKFVDRARAAGMRNDDVTAVIVTTRP